MTDATAAYFRGEWAMTRIIQNVAEGVIGEFWGESRYDPMEEEDALLCREAGVLRFKGQDYHADRSSIWSFPTPGRVVVRYTDGRPFHDFPLTEPMAEHVCGEDSYKVSYAFAEHSWRTVWEVAGPRKDYSMITEYRRIEAGRTASWLGPKRRLTL
ncbi:MAG: DUF6314 family protein [Pseudomonadota bacterium]